MNKTELVNEVAKVVGTKKEAQAAVECVFGTITEALKADNSVQRTISSSVGRLATLPKMTVKMTVMIPVPPMMIRKRNSQRVEAWIWLAVMPVAMA